MAKRERSVEKEAYWRELLARQASSGISVRAFCREQSLREPSFYSWRRKLSERDGKTCAPGGRSRRPRRALAVKFVPAMVSPPVPQSPIVLELVGGHIVKLPPSTPTSQLVELVLALEAGGDR
jgi:hypothetical protein